MRSDAICKFTVTAVKIRPLIIDSEGVFCLYAALADIYLELYGFIGREIFRHTGKWNTVEEILKTIKQDQCSENYYFSLHAVFVMMSDFFRKKDSQAMENKIGMSMERFSRTLFFNAKFTDGTGRINIDISETALSPLYEFFKHKFYRGKKGIINKYVCLILLNVWKKITVKDNVNYDQIHTQLLIDFYNELYASFYQNNKSNEHSGKSGDTGVA